MFLIKTVKGYGPLWQPQHQCPALDQTLMNQRLSDLCIVTKAKHRSVD